MYIDATCMGASDRRFEKEAVRLIRAALHPFERRLERVEVQVGSNRDGHSCRLHAWAERGQTIVVENSAASRLGAIEAAADSLRRALANHSARGAVGALVPPTDDARLPTGSDSRVPSSRVPSSRGPVPASGVQMKPVAPEGTARRPRVLLALHELDASNACLAWARLLADALRADLGVCRVLAGMPEAEGPPSGRAWLEATRRRLAATRETRRWCAAALPEVELSESLVPGAAASVAEAALRARECGADWIVMSDVREGCGRSATELASASGCPVLVARPPTSRSTLLMATDVSEDVYPISSRTAALAEALHAPVLAFHDVGVQGPELTSRVNALTDAWAKLQTERLHAGGYQRLPELEILLAHGRDRVETILQQARRDDAEIIIVGASDAFDDAATLLASGVVDRATRSVLVVPSNLPRSTPQPASVAAEGANARATSPRAGLERRSLPRVGS